MSRLQYGNHASQSPQVSARDNLRQYAHTPISHSYDAQWRSQHRPASSLAPKDMPPPPIPYEQSHLARLNPHARLEEPAQKHLDTPVFSSSRRSGPADTGHPHLMPEHRSNQSGQRSFSLARWQFFAIEIWRQDSTTHCRCCCSYYISTSCH
ncbi:hypothetical protein BS47DRAFT_638652 [Hydnum rufescens UP504]|uniref:Uncharacterized protein n=1 Tax=Hydnum rufescens UP504 TaxID=1448309 RepID=A0A9P6BA35_9AGAM|nr:hypothetical protein BS47DRAFT_638652 [Hydnum rufescens UP504]